MKNVLLTGGLGFIGSHLTDKLVARGCKVHIIDNKLTNTLEAEDMHPTQVEVIHSDIQSADLSELPKMDAVFHLASILGPSGVLKHAGNMGITILSDSVKLRDYCIEHKIPLVDISTSEIYGHAGVLEENSEKKFAGEYKIRTEYGAGKLLAEIAICNKALVNPDLKYNIIRPFNVTGPRQRPDGGFVLPRFVIAALTDQPITVFGTGKQKRGFTHVQDICEAILEVFDSGIENEIWNIGNPANEMTIEEMAKMVVRITKEKFPEKDPKIIYVDPKTIHGPHFTEAIDKVPYTRKINETLGWKAKVGVEQIIRDTIDFYQEQIANGYSFKVM